MKTRLRCRVPPVMNRKEGVVFWHEGEEIEVVMSSFWQGWIDRGCLEVTESRSAKTQGTDADDNTTVKPIVRRRGRTQKAS